MKILLLGATGATGTLVLDVARARGHAVRALARRDVGGVQTVIASLDDEGALLRALDGVDAVVSTLGIRRRTRSPWAPMAGPPDLLSRAFGVVLPAMQRAGVERVVYLSSHGVGDSYRELAFTMRFVLATSNIVVTWRDHARVEAALAASDRNWTVVRPTRLDDAPSRGPARRLRPGDRIERPIARIDVASFLVDALLDPSTHRSVVTITA